jgi:hypothetical protein
VGGRIDRAGLTVALTGTSQHLSRIDITSLNALADPSDLFREHRELAIADLCSIGLEQEAERISKYKSENPGYQSIRYSTTIILHLGKGMSSYKAARKNTPFPFSCPCRMQSLHLRGIWFIEAE